MFRCTWLTQVSQSRREGFVFRTALQAFYGFPFLKIKKRMAWLKVIGTILTSIGLPSEEPQGAALKILPANTPSENFCLSQLTHKSASSSEI